MNYVNNYQSALNQMENAFQAQTLKKEEVKVENIDIKDSGELPGINLMKINIGKIGFLISPENWKEVENYFNKKVERLS